MRTTARWVLYLTVGLIAVGFLLIFLAWNGAAGKDFIQGQFPYLLSGGLAGIGLILCGLALAAMQAHRRDMLAIADRLDQLIEVVEHSRVAGSATTPTLTAVPEGDDVFVTNGTTYHRSSCRVVAGRPGLDLISAGDVASLDLTACRVCRPAA